MNLHQFRFVQEAVRHNLNLTEAAKALHTSQPGVSKAIIELEQELGIEIFTRHGKRLKRVTEPGRYVVSSIDLILRELGNLKRIGEQYSQEDSGTLSIATTHTQARYALPRAVREFKERYPKVRLSIVQGSPPAIAQMVVDGQADIAVATETIDHHENLIALPCYRWHHVVVVPPGHALLDAPKLTLEALAAYPIITYDSAFTGRSTINQAFAKKGLAPNIVLSAIDSDVIKTYIELGLGVGILNSIAFDESRDRHLQKIDAGHLFAERTTFLALREGAYLRSFAYEFIELFTPALTRDEVDRALKRER